MTGSEGGGGAVVVMAGPLHRWRLRGWVKEAQVLGMRLELVEGPGLLNRLFRFTGDPIALELVRELAANMEAAFGRKA